MHPFTNIHVQPSVPSVSSAVSLPRLRKLTNDPAREYAQRAGEAEQLPDSVAALILSKNGYSKVTRTGIRVEGVTEKPLLFWSEHSITIAEKAGTNEKVLWVLNRLKPDVLHILTPSLQYVETIPLKGSAKWFDAADMQRELGAVTRANNRRIDRVRALHAPDSEAAVAAATANEIALKSIVHTFPASRASSPAHARDRAHDRSHASHSEAATEISPRDRQDSSATPVLPGVSGQERIADASRAGTLSERQRSNLGEVSADGVEEKGAETVELPSRAEGLARSSARAAFPKAERIHEIQRHLDGRRQSHDDREHVRHNAARFGAAVKSQIPSPKSQPATAPTEIEEW